MEDKVMTITSNTNIKKNFCNMKIHLKYYKSYHSYRYILFYYVLFSFTKSGY